MPPTRRLPFRVDDRLPDPAHLPRLERTDGKLFFVDAGGGRWRVHDTVFQGGRHRRVRPGTPRAQYRIFVNAVELRRAYAFKKGEIRELAEAHLERQLREAGYLATAPHEPPADPR